MTVDEFILEFKKVAKLNGLELYNALQDIGIELSTAHGALKIENFHTIDEKQFSSEQRLLFRRLLHEKAEELKEEYFRQNSNKRTKIGPKPYLKNDELWIPLNCPTKYRYWLEKVCYSWKFIEKIQSVHETLLELNASESVIKRYVEM